MRRQYPIFHYLVISLLVATSSWSVPQVASAEESYKEATNVKATSQTEVQPSTRPVLIAKRIETSQKPKIDGLMNEDVWLKAESTNQFFQSDPDEGQPGTEKTQVRVMYDQDTLYVFIEAFDSRPDLLIAKTMSRDVGVSGGDTVSIKIDSLNSKRNAFLFTTNPAAVKIDAIIENNQTTRIEWDAIWDVATTINDKGWTAEFKIPARSINYNDTAPGWGLQINRIIGRKNEHIRWASPDRSISLADVSKYGVLHGIRELNAGKGIEAKVYGSATYNRIEQPDSITASDIEASGDLYYRLTPKLTASATFNTDFSDTPLDSRQINTGRFSLFFPETRDFFLQDAAIFEFGGLVFSDPYFGDRNGLPFFSRNIGLAGGVSPNLDAGLKLSGEIGDVNIGLLSTRMGSIESLDEQTLSTVRMSSTLSNDSKIGFMATSGDPRGEVEQSLFGIDYQYRQAAGNGGILSIDTSVIQASGDAQSNGGFAGIAARYQSDEWTNFFMARHYDEDYDPRLGFINRQGIDSYNAMIWRFWRPEMKAIQVIDGGVSGSSTVSKDGDTDNHKLAAFANFTLPLGDWFHLDYSSNEVEINNTFSIAGLLPVESSTYGYEIINFRYSSARSREFSVSFKVNCCEIYDGDYLSTTSSMFYQPSPSLNFQIHHIYNEFKLPSGELDFQIINSTLDMSVSPQLKFSLQLQHDTISDQLSLFGRAFYEITPAFEGFVGIGHAAALQSENYTRDYQPLETGFAIRLGQTLRF
ncbi:carbohydrate binding family 9 domain-containing protein [Porticoccaceae bacterium]|nr:carbohydrate binding family 9 domain-containing protein [Porticoccaceae bacterium]